MGVPGRGAAAPKAMPWRPGPVQERPPRQDGHRRRPAATDAPWPRGEGDGTSGHAPVSQDHSVRVWGCVAHPQRQVSGGSSQLRVHSQRQLSGACDPLDSNWGPPGQEPCALTSRPTRASWLRQMVVVAGLGVYSVCAGVIQAGLPAWEAHSEHATALGGGGVAAWAPLPDPPTPTSENFPQEKHEIYQRGPKLEIDFGYTNFCLASDPPFVYVTVATEPWPDPEFLDTRLQPTGPWNPSNGGERERVCGCGCAGGGGGREQLQ